MTSAKVDVNRLTRAEAERYWNGDWTSPRCSTCGCLADNHAAGADGEPSGCKVCSRQRCSKRKRVFDWCAMHARKEADALFSRYIRLRDGVCQSCMLERKDLQCGHLISRRYLAVRWSPANAVALCMFCHKRWTENPLGWDRWCAERLGQDRWDALKFRAERGGMPDLGLVITELRTLLEDAA